VGDLYREFNEVGVRKLTDTAQVPQYAHAGDAGADLVSDEDFELSPGESKLVSTGISLVIPDGFVGLVHPRSGLAAKFQVTVLNAPGTIDSGYRGEVKVILINHGSEPRKFARGDRIAQLVIQQVERVRFIDIEKYFPSERGEGGFGSSGGHSGL
jgi:dUTP pyrophosphatase